MASLVFLRDASYPCKFMPTTAEYVACLECLTAHEIRFCDGTSQPSWKLCEKHNDDNLNAPPYNAEMLEFLREGVFDGSIPKPEPVKSKVMALQSSLERFSKSGPGFRLLQNTIMQSNKIRSANVLWPITSFTYSHTVDCVHHPDFASKAAALTAAKKPVGTTTSGLRPSVKLLKAKAAFQKLDEHQRERMTGIRSEIVIRQAGRREALVLLQELGNDNENSPRRDDTAPPEPEPEPELLVQVNPEEDWDLIHTRGLEQQLRTIQSDLQATRLAKGVFFRHCNGAYVNALGWVWTSELEILNQDHRSSTTTVAHTTRSNAQTDEESTTIVGTPPSSSSTTAAAPISSKSTARNTGESFPTSQLQTREDLMRTGHVDETDLILTAWMWNVQWHKAVFSGVQ